MAAGLQAQSGCSKSVLAAILRRFSQDGLLDSSVVVPSLRQVRRKITSATLAHARAATPRAPVAQTLDLGDGVTIEHAGPFAYLH